MQSFIIWLESRKNKSAKDFILSYFNLDDKKGVNQLINYFDKNKIDDIKSTGFYAELSRDSKKSFNDVIEKENSTILDLINSIK